MGTFTNSKGQDEMPHIMRHFIRVYTVCKSKKDLQTKEFFENHNLTLAFLLLQTMMGTFTNSRDPDEMPHNMQHFIRVSTVCKGKKRSSDIRVQSFLNIIT